MANFKVNSVPSWVQYTATSSQTEFSIPYPFINNADISVWQNGVLLVLTTDYTLSGANTASGGLLTLNTGASLNDIITIQDLMVVDRTNIYLAVISALTGSALNNDFNRDVIMIRDTQTTVNYLMLQYPPWVPISQDIDVTTDRILPLLPALSTWQKNASNTAIIAVSLPTTVVGVEGSFTNDNRITTTNLGPGDNYIQQTDLQLVGDTITAISGNLTLTGTNNVSITTSGDVSITPGANLYLDGTQWPTNSPAPLAVPRFKSASTTQMEWAIVPTIDTSSINNAIVTFDGTSGGLQSSNLSIISNEISTFSGDLTLGATTNNMLVTNDPTQALGIATKQYVDSMVGGGDSLTWSTSSSTTITGAVKTGTVLTSGSLQTMNLPATFAVGQVIALEGDGAGGWVAQAFAGTNIIMGTTVGVSGGSVASTDRYNNVYLLGLVADTTWKVQTTNGTLTLT